jgi:hypothetical protein
MNKRRNFVPALCLTQRNAVIFLERLKRPIISESCFPSPCHLRTIQSAKRFRMEPCNTCRSGQAAKELNGRDRKLRIWPIQVASRQTSQILTIVSLISNAHMMMWMPLVLHLTTPCYRCPSEEPIVRNRKIS